jgi:hypothetical protein
VLLSPGQGDGVGQVTMCHCTMCLPTTSSIWHDECQQLFYGQFCRWKFEFFEWQYVATHGQYLEALTNHAKMKKHLHDFDESWETMQTCNQPHLELQMLGR